MDAAPQTLPRDDVPPPSPASADGSPGGLPPALAALLARLADSVVAPMKSLFIGKDEVVDLMALCLVAGENLFLYGPPGTAKTALVHALARGVQGKSFDYLLTRFTEPSELFGPFDIRRLREGELVTNTTGMLPTADLVFLDELLNANSAILNSLLLALNERIFRRGAEKWKLPALLFVGASNHLPEDEALKALFDRFLVRVRCDDVPGDRLQDLLVAGWRLQQPDVFPEAGLSADDVRRMQAAVPSVDLAELRPFYAECILRLRQAGFTISDRRAVRMQRLAAASALLAGRSAALPQDAWVLRHLWDQEDQIEPLVAQVRELLRGLPQAAPLHPRTFDADLADPEALAAELESLAKRLQPLPSGAELVRLRDQLSLLARRAAWVASEVKRKALETRIEQCWKQILPGGTK